MEDLLGGSSQKGRFSFKKHNGNPCDWDFFRISALEGALAPDTPSYATGHTGEFGAG